MRWVRTEEVNAEIQMGEEAREARGFRVCCAAIPRAGGWDRTGQGPNSASEKMGAGEIPCHAVPGLTMGLSSREPYFLWGGPGAQEHMTGLRLRGLLGIQSGKQHFVTSATFHWLKQVLDPAQVQGTRLAKDMDAGGASHWGYPSTGPPLLTSPSVFAPHRADTGQGVGTVW